MNRGISILAAIVNRLRGNPRLFGGVAVLAGLAVVWLFTPSVQVPNPEADVAQATGPEMAQTPPASPRNEQMDQAARLAAWEKVRLRLEQTDRESVAALAQALSQVSVFFAERRQGARPFAEWLTSFGGKLRYAAGRMDQAGFIMKQLFSNGSLPPMNSVPDQFAAEIRQKFTECVLDPARCAIPSPEPPRST